MTDTVRSRRPNLKRASDPPNDAGAVEASVAVEKARLVHTASEYDPREVAIYRHEALLTELERIYGRQYMHDEEVELGLPQPQLSTEEAVRLEKLRWLADDERGPARALLFGSQAARDRLAETRLACPTFAPVIDAIDRAAALSMLTDSAISVPPVLLLGPPGIGKTHASKLIAKALGTTINAFSCATNSDAQQLIVGHPTSWRGSRMSVLNEALVGANTAQPVILLDEVDKFQTHRDEQPYHVLLTILEPENSRAVQDEYLRIPFNLSHTVIIATANDAERLPGYIQDRLLIFDIPAPRGDDLLAITRMIATIAIDEARGVIREPSEEVIARLARANPRRITRIVRLSLGFAAAAGRRHLTITDVDAADSLATGAAKANPIGFLTARNADRDAPRAS